MSISDYHARRARPAELVTHVTPRGERLEVPAVEERVDGDVRTMRLEAAAGPGFRAGARVLVGLDGRILQLAGLCRDCAVGPGEMHRPWCPRRAGGATVSARDTSLLKGWS